MCKTEGEQGNSIERMSRSPLAILAQMPGLIMEQNAFIHGEFSFVQRK